MTENAKIVIDAIYSRRSIRAYEERPLEKEVMIELLKTGMAAPSACNLQPWEFLVVTEKESMDKLRAAAEIYGAPAAVIALADSSNIPWNGDDWKIDCSAAIQNMMIAASALGVGSLWVGSSDENAVRSAFNIPDSIHYLGVIAFGYPAESKIPATKYCEDAIHWEKYDSGRKRQLRTMDMLMTDGYQTK